MDLKIEPRLVIKYSLIYCGLSAAFSLIGILVPERAIQENPIFGLSLHEITGHILWGLVAGAVTVSLRYTLLGGAFAVLIDSDHLIGFTNIEAISRISHSIPFAITAFVIMMFVFGKRDYLLGAVACGSVFAHMSFDTFSDTAALFPIFAPFSNQRFQFSQENWLFFELIAIAIILGATIIKSSRLKKRIIS